MGHLSESCLSGKCKFTANFLNLHLKVKSMYIFKGIGYYCVNEKTIAKYPKIYLTIEFILLVFPSLYMVESRF